MDAAMMEAAVSLDPTVPEQRHQRSRGERVSKDGVMPVRRSQVDGVTDDVDAPTAPHRRPRGERRSQDGI
eukprot:6744687-Prymnesium_polylepis.1